MTARKKLRELVNGQRYVIVPGAYDPLTARLVELAGFEAVYLTGGGYSRANGLPDLGLFTMTENVEFIARAVRILTPREKIACIPNGISVAASASFSCRISSWAFFSRSSAAFASAPNFFVAKFAATGGHVWSKAHGDQNTVKALAIAVDANADVVVTGEFHGTTDLGGGTVRGTAMYTDVFLAKYAGTDGAFRWAQAIVGNLGATPSAIATDR